MSMNANQFNSMCPGWFTTMMAIILVAFVLWIANTPSSKTPKYEEQMDGMEDPYWAP